MPIYEYHCRACGSDSELIQRLSDPPARKCPVCGKSQLTKVVSAAGFRLKGGGWYETDFKSGSKKNVAGDKPEPSAASAPAAGESGGGAKSEGKSEAKSKPDPKPDKPAKSDKGDKGDKKTKPAKAA